MLIAVTGQTVRVDELAGAVTGLGVRVRGVRNERGWSLDALAVRSGVAKGALVALEGGTGNPTLTTLLRVADALGVSLTRLVEDGGEPAVRTWAVEQQTVLWKGPGGSVATLLAGSDGPGVLELWRYDLVDGEGRASDSHVAGTRELVHVLAGRLVVESGPEVVELSAGGSARLAGDLPHRYVGGPGGGTGLVCVSLPGPV